MLKDFDFKPPGMIDHFMYFEILWKCDPLKNCGWDKK